MRTIPLAVSVSVLLMSAGGTHAQGGAKEKNEAPASSRVLIVETNDWDRMLVSPKDAALRRALDLLPARIREVPGEIPPGEEPPPPEAFALLSGLVNAPMRMVLEYSAENQGGFMGAGLLVSFGRPDGEAARRDAGLVKRLMSGAPLRPRESAEYPGMSEVVTPLGVVRFGPHETAGAGKGAGSPWAYEIRAGTLADEGRSDEGLFAAQVPGFEAHTRVRFDAAPLAPFFEFAEVLAANDPGAAQALRHVRESGVFGGEGRPALTATYLAGHTPDRSLSLTTISGAAAHADLIGLSREALTPADLRAVPADAHWGHVGRVNAATLLGHLTRLSQQPEAQEGLDEFTRVTGVDLIGDLIGQLGGAYALYLSDSTGGGGMYSIAAVLSLKDGRRFDAAVQKVAEAVNSELRKPEGARGYAQVRRWTDERAPGCGFMSISFPGLPVPIEVTAGMTPERLVLALSPQGAIAAARQAASANGAGILDNPRIAEALAGRGTGGMITFSFNDTARTLREGYPLVSMIGSMVGNLVRSREVAEGEARNPALVTPTYAELLDGARCTVGWSSWAGDDYVFRCEGDRSALVRAAASAGRVAPFLPLVELAVAAGALDDQRKKFEREMHDRHEHGGHEHGEEGEGGDHGDHEP
ncbi:MAG: hypothetical protein AB7K52_09740 [Phycisphaerales bacterium]